MILLRITVYRHFFGLLLLCCEEAHLGAATGRVDHVVLLLKAKIINAFLVRMQVRLSSRRLLYISNAVLLLLM